MPAAVVQLFILYPGLTRNLFSLFDHHKDTVLDAGTGKEVYLLSDDLRVTVGDKRYQVRTSRYETFDEEDSDADG